MRAILLLILLLIHFSLEVEDKCKYNEGGSQIQEQCGGLLGSTISGSASRFSECLDRLCFRHSETGDECIDRVQTTSSEINETDLRCKESYKCTKKEERLRHCPSGVEIRTEFMNALVKGNPNDYISSEDLLKIATSKYFWEKGLDFKDHFCDNYDCVAEKFESYKNGSQNMQHSIETLVVGIAKYNRETLHYFSSFSRNNEETSCSIKYFVEFTDSQLNDKEHSPPSEGLIKRDTKNIRTICDNHLDYKTIEHIPFNTFDWVPKRSNLVVTHIRMVDMVRTLERSALQHGVFPGHSEQEMGKPENYPKKFRTQILCSSVCEVKKSTTEIDGNKTNLH